MLAEVTFAIGEPHEATVIPKAAVITRGTERFVYRIDGNTVERVAVSTGLAVGDWVEVEADSAATDER